MLMDAVKKRDVSIDILKFFAVILITNSHMAHLYVKFSALATGGAIGDVFFFFCSGFTLFLSKQRRFDNYYKRRINRIYPTVFMWALLASVLFNNKDNMQEIANSTSKCKITKCFCKSTPLVLRNSIFFLVSH